MKFHTKLTCRAICNSSGVCLSFTRSFRVLTTVSMVLTLTERVYFQCVIHYPTWNPLGCALYIPVVNDGVFRVPR
jgi:hypothetical protein